MGIVEGNAGTLFAGTVVVVALLSATVTMLYLTIRNVLAHITPGDHV